MTPEISRVLNAPWTLRRGLAGLNRDQQDSVDMRAAWAWWLTYSQIEHWTRQRLEKFSYRDKSAQLEHDAAMFRRRGIL